MQRSPLALVVLVMLALLGAGDTPPTGGTITGRVLVIKDRRAVTRGDVYVYLEDVNKRSRRHRKLPGAGVKKQIRQQNEEFVPSVLVVPVGAEVAFPNYDREEHNVFSPTDPPFDLGRYSTDRRGKSQKFEVADEFSIFCDIHRKMMATVKVVNSPFIQPVKAGTFAFQNVPPGTYRVVAWVRDSEESRSDPVVVRSGGRIALPAELHLQLATRSTCHNRADGTPYDKYAPCPSPR